MKVKEESGKAGLKLNTQKTKIMASSSITLWQIGKQCKQWQILFSWAPNSLKKVTAAMKLKDTCSWKKSNDKPNQCIEKQRHYFAHKGPSSQSYGFSSRHVGESWTIKKAEYQRIDALELWCWIRLFRVPWISRRSNQSILKEINPKYS